MADELTPGDPGTIEAGTPPPADDPEAGKAGQPDDPNVPKDSTLKSEKFADDPDAEYRKHLEEGYQQNLKRSEHFAQEQQGLIDSFKKSAAETDAIKPPTNIFQNQQLPQEAKQHITQTVFQVLAIAATAFAVFGTRRNPYTQGALMKGLGDMFTNISKGRVEQAKEQQQTWHELNQSVMEENKQRLEGYKDLIANKKLGLSQQMELIKANAEFNKDQILAQKAGEGDLSGVLNNLHQKQRQLDQHARQTPKGGGKDNAEQQRYRQLVLEKSNGTIDYDQEPAKAFALYPYSKFLNDEKARQTQETKTGGKETRGGFQSGGSDNNDPLDLGLIQPKTGSAQPSGTPSVLAPSGTQSVLAPGGDANW